LWGGVCGTLPDLDSFIDHGDPIRNMTLHRAESHALFYLTLAAPLLAWLPARLHGELHRFRRWWLAVWLALVTHPLLDAMTVYGTQLGLPFTDHPFSVGSIFIIDPLYTLSLLVGVIAALAASLDRGLRWNAVGLVLSTGYLAGTFIAQQHVTHIARTSLEAQGIPAQQVLVTPTPFNTVLWRIVALTPAAYHEGFHSLLDDEQPITLDRFERRPDLYAALRGDASVARLAWFSHGFFAMREHGPEVHISDLRMGQEPTYVFTFAVARRTGSELVPIEPRSVEAQYDVGRSLAWVWRRLRGERLPPPRDATGSLVPQGEPS
jgi:inner membrane protein